MNIYPALEPVKQFLLKNPPTQFASKGATKSKTYRPDNAFDSSVAVLRLDSEVQWLSDVEPDWETVVPLLIGQINGDMTDLIDNGDRTSTDPLLKALDGKKKHGGKEPAMVEFFDITVVAEPKPRKFATEYTVWLKARVRWL